MQPPASAGLQDEEDLDATVTPKQLTRALAERADNLTRLVAAGIIQRHDSFSTRINIEMKSYEVPQGTLTHAEYRKLLLSEIAHDIPTTPLHTGELMQVWRFNEAQFCGGGWFEEQYIYNPMIIGG